MRRLASAPITPRRLRQKIKSGMSAKGMLGERGLVPGWLLEVKELRALDGVVTVEDEDGTTYSLGQSLAGSTFVRRYS
jgi:hypothetical protein